jgi:hypothetical protein
LFLGSVPRRKLGGKIRRKKLREGVEGRRGTPHMEGAGKHNPSSGDAGLRATPEQEKIVGLLGKIAAANFGSLDLKVLKFDLGDLAAIGAVACFLAQNTSATRVSLATRGITDGGAKLIARALRQSNTVLQELVLSGNRIGDGGAARLSELLKTDRMLRHLDISSNEISARGLSDLLSGATKNRTLEVLNISGNTGVAQHDAADPQLLLGRAFRLFLEQNEHLDALHCRLARDGRGLLWSPGRRAAGQPDAS